MRGVLRYRRDDVVAILDSTRARARSRTACRSSRSVDDALALRPDDRARRRRDAGRTLPARVDRAAEELHRATGSTSRTACTSSSPTIPSSRSSRRGTASSCATCAARRPISRRRPARTSHVPGTIVLTVGSDCAIGKMTVSLELDREARCARRRVDLRPDRADRDRDRRLGHRGRRRRRRLHRRRGRAARRRGERARGRAALGRGPGRRSSIRSTRASRSASTTAARRICSSSATRRARPRSRARAAGRIRSRRSASSSSCTSGSRCPPGRRRWSPSR